MDSALQIVILQKRVFELKIKLRLSCQEAKRVLLYTHQKARLYALLFRKGLIYWTA
jgi:hypothetical protein